ncbi:sensor histidine kinase [Propionibacteriaceae bacterium Y2011]
MAWTLLIGIAIGVIAGVLIMVWRHRRALDGPPETRLAPPEPEVPREVAELVSLLHAAAIVVGPHDEVLSTSRAAVGSGLVRGSRIIVKPLLELVREVRRERSPAIRDLEVPRGRGLETTHFALRVAPISDTLVIALADDLTQARRVDAVRRDFVANVSHELKTPIGAISLLAEAVEGAADDPVAVRRFAGRMGVESHRLSELVVQVIELSRLQSTDPFEAGDVVEVDTVLNEAVDRSRVDAGNREISLRTAGEQGLVVYGSEVQLVTALANLVENAVIYSDPGAKVVLSARQYTDEDGARVELAVSDNGIGISEVDRLRIFERFYRVDYARSRANGGTGLGLAIVKHITAAHGGSVEVWSRPGEGSTFTIVIPEHPELRDAVAARRRMESTDGPGEDEGEPMGHDRAVRHDQLDDLDRQEGWADPEGPHQEEVRQ